MVKATPAGYHSVTPSLTLKHSKKAIAFYQKAFGAKVLDTFPNMQGDGLMHAVIQIGNSLIMMGDEMPGMSSKSAETMGGSPISLYIYADDADALFKQAVAAGATAIMPVMEMFWGDRAGHLRDPFGYQWMIATHTRDMSKDEIRKEAGTFFAKFSKS